RAHELAQVLGRLQARMWRYRPLMEKVAPLLESARNLQSFVFLGRHHASACAAANYLAHEVSSAVACCSHPGNCIVVVGPEKDKDWGDATAHETCYVSLFKDQDLLTEDHQPGPRWIEFRDRFRKTIPEWAPSELVAALDLEASAADTPAQAHVDAARRRIPSRRRTIPLTIKKAARQMGYGGTKAAESLRKAMDAGAI